jgi:S-adenosylmethionine synthetase
MEATEKPSEKETHMYLFTSESVSPGHPDKCADILSDTIVDACLAYDPEARVAAEVMIAGRDIFVGGEIGGTWFPGEAALSELAEKALRKAGYGEESGFSPSQTLHPKDIRLTSRIRPQSPEIAAGVKRGGGEVGAGDQGIMFGYACDETPEKMPAALYYARKIRDALHRYAVAHPFELGVDIKTQVTLDYGSRKGFYEGSPKRVDTVVVSAPYPENFGRKRAEELIRCVIRRSGIPEDLFDERTVYLVNPSGSYVGHGPLFDAGLTGRKLIVDTYGGYAPIGGGAQSGKDWTKVDRSGLYAARWLARGLVENGFARKALVQLSYAIGRAEPVSVTVDTFGTGHGDDVSLSEAVRGSFPLTPAWIRDRFGLDAPSGSTFLYADTAAWGQVGLPGLPWETGFENFSLESI